MTPEIKREIEIIRELRNMTEAEEKKVLEIIQLLIESGSKSYDVSNTLDLVRFDEGHPEMPFRIMADVTAAKESLKHQPIP